MNGSVDHNRPLAGRVALVTGAGGGIGLGIARRLAAAGSAVIIAEVDPAAGDQAARSIAAEFGVATEFITTDVTQRDEIEAAVALGPERHGRLDILVNNAWGGGGMGRLEHKTDDAMAHGLGMALWPGFWSMRGVPTPQGQRNRPDHQHVFAQRRQRASVHRRVQHREGSAARRLTRTAAREWARHGITANVICPAAATAAFHAVVAQNPEIGIAAAAANPMGRMGDAEDDIGGVAAFLASDAARYLTGNTLFVDGGAHINGAAWDPEMPD